MSTICSIMVIGVRNLVTRNPIDNGTALICTDAILTKFCEVSREFRMAVRKFAFSSNTDSQIFTTAQIRTSIRIPAYPHLDVLMFGSWSINDVHVRYIVHHKWHIILYNAYAPRLRLHAFFLLCLFVFGLFTELTNLLLCVCGSCIYVCTVRMN